MKIIENTVINESLASEHLKIFYPYIQKEITELSSQNNFAGVIQAAVNYIKNLLKDAKINIANHHIKMMGWIYSKGKTNVKIVIENIFVRSFGSFKNLVESHQWFTIYSQMPNEFQQIYIKQMRHDEILLNKK